MGEPLASRIEEQLVTEGLPWFEAVECCESAQAIRILDRPIGLHRLLSCAPAAVMGTLIAVARYEGIELWDMDQSRKLGSLEPISSAPAVMVRFARHPNGALLFVAHEDGAMALWSVDDFKGRTPLVRWQVTADWNCIFPAPRVIAADVSEEGHLVASLHGLEDCPEIGLTFKVCAMGGSVLPVGGDLAFAARALAFEPSTKPSKLVVVGGEFDRKAKGLEALLAGGVVNPETGRTIESQWRSNFGGARIMVLNLMTGHWNAMDLPSLAPLTAVAWFGNASFASRIAVGDRTGSIAILDSDGRVNVLFPSLSLAAAPELTDTSLRPDLRHVKVAGGHSTAIRTLAFSQDGLWLFSAGNAPGKPSELMMWDLEKENLGIQVPFEDDIDSIHVLSPAKLVVVGPEIIAQVNISRKPQESASYRFPTALALAGNGAWLAQDDGVDIVVRNGSARRVIERAHLSEIRSLAWHPHDPVLASGGDDGAARLWDAVTGELKREFPWSGDSVHSVRFSTGGEALAIAGDSGHCRIYQLDGSPSRDLSACDGKDLECVAIGPEGFVAAGSVSGLIHLWDAKSGRTVLAGHLGSVNAVAFIAGRLVSGGEDGTVRVWDIGARKELRRASTEHPICGVFSTPEFPVVIATSWSGVIAVTLDRERPMARSSPDTGFLTGRFLQQLTSSVLWTHTAIVTTSG